MVPSVSDKDTPETNQRKNHYFEDAAKDEGRLAETVGALVSLINA